MSNTTHTNDAKPEKRKLFRVEVFYTQDRKPIPNTDVGRYGRLAMYPFELMRPGEFFVVEAARNRLRAVVAAVAKHSSRTGRQFEIRQSTKNPKRIKVTRLT